MRRVRPAGKSAVCYCALMRITVWLLGWSLVTGVASADGVTLRARFAPGQVWTTTRTISMDVKGTVDPGNGPQPLVLGQSEVITITETVLAATEGRRTRVRRLHVRQQQTRRLDGRSRNHVHPLQGREVELAELTGKDGKTRVVVVTPKDLPAAVRAELTIADRLQALLPAVPVPVGHRWQRSGEPVRTLLGMPAAEFRGGRLHGELLELGTHSGQRAARISLQLEVDGVSSSKAATRVALVGTLWVGLQTRIPLRIELKGDVRMSGGPRKLALTGPMVLTQTAHLGPATAQEQPAR